MNVNQTQAVVEEEEEVGVTEDLVRYDFSVTAFYQIYYCQPREPCKEQFRQEFMCRCTNRQVCVSPGKFYDAFCQVETMGVIWVQPRIIEYHGRIIILQPSAPHKNEIKLLTFSDKR